MNLLSCFLKEQAVYVTLSFRSSLKNFLFTKFQVTLLSSIVFASCSRNCQAACWEQVYEAPALQTQLGPVGEDLPSISHIVKNLFSPLPNDSSNSFLELG